MLSSKVEATSKLLGKSAIVTASTDGIGLSIAKRLAVDGANVVLSSRQQKNVDRALSDVRKFCEEHNASGKVEGVVAHVAKAEDRTKLIEKALSSFGKLDIVVSNAAVSPAFGPILETTETVWDKIFEINVKNAFLLAKESAPHLQKAGDGSIVFISSIAGYQPMKFLGAYSVSKTALLGLTKALASEMGDVGVRVNCVCPGIIKTKFSQPLWESEDIKTMMMYQTPLKRLGEADEIGGVVSFLCSQDASYITGENVVVAGGMLSSL